LFNKRAGTKLDVRLASLDALKAKPARICPLVCDHGYRADGERCVKINCGAGSVVNDGDGREKKSKRPAAKSEAKRESRPGAKSQQTASESSLEPQSSGQIICTSSACRPVKKGCHLGAVRNSTNPSVSVTGEICD
jgi:hypothetical protein